MPHRDPTLVKQISCSIRLHREKTFPGTGGQGKCAKEFGATPNKWSKWENGHAVPTDLEQRKLADFFGITLAELRGEDSSPTSAESKISVKSIDYWRGQVDLLKEENNRLRKDLAVSHSEILTLNKENEYIKGRLESILEKRDAIRRRSGSA